MPILVLLAFLLLGGAAVVCSAFAASNARRRGRYLLLGTFAGRDMFTPRGWRYRNWSLALFALSFLLLFAWAGWRRTYGRRGEPHPESLTRP